MAEPTICSGPHVEARRPGQRWSSSPTATPWSSRRPTAASTPGTPVPARGWSSPAPWRAGTSPPTSGATPSATAPTVRPARRRRNRPPWCTGHGSTPDQRLGRVLQDGGDVGQEARSLLTVDEAVVERERERRDPARPHLAPVHPRLLTYHTERHDRRLPRRQDRGAGIDAEHTHVRDRHRPAGHVRRRRLAFPSGGGQLVDRHSEVAQGQPVGVLDVRNDETTRRGRGNAQVDVALDDDFAGLVIPAGIDIRCSADGDAYGP